MQKWILFGPSVHAILLKYNFKPFLNMIFYKLYLGCFGSFCLPCQSGDNGEALSESYWLCFLTACFAPYISTFLTRRKLRKQYGIQGSDFEDVVASVCCGCCANIQIANELDARKA